jgi:glutamine amidotransferase
MAGLHEVDAGRIVGARLAQQRPVLGICVGMQVMFTRGVEHGIESDGLAVLPGSVERLDAPILPHMGWNTVKAPSNSLLFKGLSADTRFYFVHSYAARDIAALPSECIVTTAEHGEVFAAAVESGAMSATQFHPEKSADAGAEVLANWLSAL